MLQDEDYDSDTSDEDFVPQGWYQAMQFKKRV